MAFDPFSIYDVPPELETEEPTEEAILRLCASSQEQLARRLVSSSREETEAVQDSLRTAFSSNPPVASLGDLDRLPREIVAMILPHLDVLSYFRFRQLNRLARQLCTELVKEYQVIVTHGLQGLRGLLCGNLDHRFTILDLYRVLTTRDCVLCGAFGGFMYLPSALRCCYPCITTADELLVLDSAVFYEQAGVSLADAQPILVGSTLRTVPGPYDKSDQQDKPENDRPQYLISAKEALEELAAHGLLHQPTSLSKMASEHQQFSTRSMASTALPWYNPHTSEADDGVCCEGEQGDYEWTEHISDRIERAKLDRSFPTEEFFSHFLGCDAAKSWWAVVKYSGQDTRYMKLV
ncbi:hypothetical protein PG985_007735 [Apiospora marii]|uniref:F-box domain-containing protein n=1 Tax=Apiospora marii TaxID=335849 RepID=A0ABR1SS00_9PEZI